MGLGDLVGLMVGCLCCRRSQQVPDTKSAHWHFMGECLPGARQARYLCFKYLISSPGLSSPWEVPQVDRTRPQTFSTRHLA